MTLNKSHLFPVASLQDLHFGFFSSQLSPSFSPCRLLSPPTSSVTRWSNRVFFWSTVCRSCPLQSLVHRASSFYFLDVVWYLLLIVAGEVIVRISLKRYTTCVVLSERTCRWIALCIKVYFCFTTSSRTSVWFGWVNPPEFKLVPLRQPVIRVDDFDGGLIAFIVTSRAAPRRSVFHSQ